MFYTSKKSIFQPSIRARCNSTPRTDTYSHISLGSHSKMRPLYVITQTSRCNNSMFIYRLIWGSFQGGKDIIMMKTKTITNNNIHSKSDYAGRLVTQVTTFWYNDTLFAVNTSQLSTRENSVMKNGYFGFLDSYSLLSFYKFSQESKLQKPKS